MSQTLLCRLDDIPERGSIGLVAEIGGKKQGLIVVRRSDKAFVYINVCPHVGAPLDFTPGQFLNLERSHIQCANHGAKFRIDDGFCIFGPCSGESLEAVETEIRDGTIHIL